MDYIEREFMVGTVPAALLTMDGLVSKQHITLSILNPLMRAKIPTDNGKDTLLFIEENVLCAVEQAELSTVSEVLERMMNGFAVLLLDNCPTALAFGTQGFAARGVDEPDTEVMQRGSREGFVETYQTNISLLRRRLKTTELKFEKVTVGEESQTPAALCYLKNIADPKIINTLKKRLSACNLKDVLAAGYLAGYLERPAIFDRVGFTERPDTLCGKLLEQPEEKAKEIALSLELFTTGSLDIFGHESTVDLDKRIVVFDIHGLGEQLKPTGLLVITDTILNRVTLNWKKGKRTHIFIDEFHVVFENEQSGIFFNSAWRQFRKRNGYPTAITQNVEYLLDSVQASTMLSNSEFVVMLNQAFSDRAKLSKLLNISDEQMSYVTNADAGCGLIKYGSALVPFINRFPKDTELYRLMTTRPGEGVFGNVQR